MKKALISGITGQDGSYLAEFLLEKGYEVHGIIRRSSSVNTKRIDNIFDRIKLHYGDLTDSGNINELVRSIMPDEIYNLAAQSHVKVSFELPEYTAQVDAVGTLRFLDAIKNIKPDCRFYQASTSELYGKVQEIPQSEMTPFYPRSPYGVAKLYGFWILKNYRESYNLHASNGILFNHETVASFTPMVYKNKTGIIDIKPIGEIVKDDSGVSIDEEKREYQCGIPLNNLEVWDNGGWTKVKAVSCYPHNVEEDNKYPKIINARNSVFMATEEHEVIMENKKDTPIKELIVGDKINNIEGFPYNETEELTKKECFLLGVIVGDGYIDDRNRVRITSSSEENRKLCENIWKDMGGTDVYYYPSKSGFTGDIVGQIDLRGNTEWLKRFDVYTSGHKKRIPWQILNTTKENQIEFLKGYNQADGLKNNPCVYEFKNFKTNSATLAQGLIYLISNVTNQDFNITIEESEKWGYKTFYYSINLLSDSKSGQNHKNSVEKGNDVKKMLDEGMSQREICRLTGISRTFIRKIQNGYEPTNEHHLSKPKNEIKKIIDYSDYDGWFYDLETESGTFHCGVGLGHVHNSPRRGETFVTRKITQAVARIAKGKQDVLELGNLDSKRDWGHAKEYVEAQWMILQQDTPDDYVIATGRTEKVRTFVEMAFKRVNMDITWEGEGVDEVGKWNGNVVVKVNPKFYRPAEVDLLIGDPTKAKEVLGWEAKISLEELVTDMMAHDLEEV
jgi:GDPmannose 4,6-dehydratase